MIDTYTNLYEDVFEERGDDNSTFQYHASKCEIDDASNYSDWRESKKQFVTIERRAVYIYMSTNVYLVTNF